MKEYINNLGTFDNVIEVWNAYPYGGVEGDYVIIGGKKIEWDKYTQSWGSADSSPAKKTLYIDGDLRVTGEIRANKIRGLDNGLWLTSEALNEAIPDPIQGYWAAVGTGFPAELWVCTKDGKWENSGTLYYGGDIEVNIDGNVVNNPDYEDITLIGNALKFADKIYQPSVYSGYGRVYLRKNIIEGVNVLSQDMLAQANTTYIVQYNYDARGKDIIIPSGCELRYEGGSISNGTIIGNGTTISAGQYHIFGDNVTISGEWCCAEIYDTWFPLSEAIGANNTRNLQNLCNLTSDNTTGVIHLSGKTYYASIAQNGDNESVMKVNSNTEVKFDCTIRLNTNDFTNYRLISITNKENVYIHGSGRITGDVEGKTIGTGEWGHGIAIIDSRNIKIEGITIEKCWGDGIYIGQSVTDATYYSEDVIVRNVVCDYNRRQGMSIATAYNLLVDNCQFTNTGIIKGTPPAFGVDIEPNLLGVKLKITFRDCVFVGNSKGGLLVLNGVNDTDIRVENCVSDGNFKLASNARNVTYRGCSFPNLETSISPSATDNISFIDCHIATNEGIFFKNFYPYTFEGCTFNEDSGVSRRVYRLSTTADNYVCKVLIPASSVADGYYKITAMGGFNVRNINYISEFYVRVRKVSSTRTVGRSITRIISPNNGGVVDLEDYKNNGFLMNAPILDSDENLVMYIINANNVRYDIALIVESYAFDGGERLVGCRCSAVAAAEMPNADFSFVPNTPTKGTTSRIGTYIAKQAGVCVFNTSVNKAVWWNGSAWVDAMGNAI